MPEKEKPPPNEQRWVRTLLLMGAEALGVDEADEGLLAFANETATAGLEELAVASGVGVGARPGLSGLPAVRLEPGCRLKGCITMPGSCTRPFFFSAAGEVSVVAPIH